jgi:hypothetical protein
MGDECSQHEGYMVKNRITHNKIQCMVWSNGNALADVEETEIKQWDGTENGRQKKSSPALLGERDGEKISFQREERRKIEARVGIMYPGKKTIADNHKRLENKVCMTKVVNNSEEWKQTM